MVQVWGRLGCPVAEGINAAPSKCWAKSWLERRPWVDQVAYGVYYSAPVFSLRSHCLIRTCRGRPHEANIPPSEPQASAQARFSSQTADEGRSSNPSPAPAQGAQAPRSDGSEEVGSATKRRYRFPRGARIRRKSDIQVLYRRGKRRRTGHLDVFVSASPASRPRVVLVVPKHGHKIVERNKLKRRIRESARLELLPRCWDEGVDLDILIRALPQAYDAEFGQLRKEIMELAEQLCSHGSS